VVIAELIALWKGLEFGTVTVAYVPKWITETLVYGIAIVSGPVEVRNEVIDRGWQRPGAPFWVIEYDAFQHQRHNHRVALSRGTRADIKVL